MDSTREVSRVARNGFKGIAATLQQRIADGGLESGRYLPTERELQEEFGASRSTVRRALAVLVESGWAETVPSKGVVAGTGARKVRGTNVALIDGSTYVLRVLMVRLADVLRDNGFHLVHLGGYNDYSLEGLMKHAAENEFAGALVWPFEGFPEVSTLRQLTRETPTVCLDHAIRGVQRDLVTFDYFNAAVEATEHLIKMGCRNIAVTGMLDMLDATHDRFNGYMHAMFRNGLQPRPRDYVFNFTSGSQSPDVLNLARRLSEPDRPDGLFVLQDEFVPATVETALAAGLRMPQDVQIVTIGDDVDVSVDDCGLTAVALDWEAFAVQAVQLLLERIAEPSRPIQTRFAPHRLIVRGLCGAPRSTWTQNPDELTGFHGSLPYPRSQYRFTTTMRQEVHI